MPTQQALSFNDLPALNSSPRRFARNSRAYTKRILTGFALMITILMFTPAITRIWASVLQNSW